MSDDPDAADVRAVLAGDVEAFAGVVRRWQGPLYRIARDHCGTREEAEDLTQEIFLRIYRSLARWRRRARFSTWVHAIAFNACRSHLRARRPRPEPIAADVVDPSTVPAAEDEAPSVQRALDGLPRAYRDALAAFYLRSLDLRGAALCLGLSEGTLKARLHRGRILLAALLAPSRDAEEIRR